MSILFSCGVNFVQGNFLQEPEKVMAHGYVGFCFSYCAVLSMLFVVPAKASEFRHPREGRDSVSCFGFGASRGPTHVLVRFRPPSMASELLLSCLRKEKVTKENSTLGTAPSLRDGSLRSAGVSPTVHPWTAAKAARSLAPPRASAGLIRPPFAAPQRDPSEKIIKRKRAGSRSSPGRRAWSDSLVFCFGFCGQDGRALLLPGSLSTAARTGGRSPKGRAHDARAFAVGTWTCRQRTSGESSLQSFGHDAQTTAAARVPLLFGYFLLGKQEKVTRAPGMAYEKTQGRESVLARKRADQTHKQTTMNRRAPIALPPPAMREMKAATPPAPATPRCAPRSADDCARDPRIPPSPVMPNAWIAFGSVDWPSSPPSRCSAEIIASRPARRAPPASARNSRQRENHMTINEARKPSAICSTMTMPK